MANLEVYQKFYKVGNVEELISKFQETLMISNKSFAYFVDWRKVKANIKKYEYEINILNYLVGVSEPKVKLREILFKNPEVLPVLPLIIAVRDLEIAVIEDPVRPSETLKKYDFNKKNNLSKEEVDDVVNFCHSSGVLNLFIDLKIKNLRDYLLGLETGIDTNARKNRSGDAMESLISPILDRIKDIKVIKQKTFKYLKEEEGIDIPQKLLNRKFDYVIITNDKKINLEVNYYDGQGSKPQEIVDSYINRNNELLGAKWGFIWLSDGMGWKKGLHQMTNAFNDMDYVLNIEFARKGILNEIIKS
ncbi:MAG: type II restriction endonuclease [Candidatus Omnitrophica bacterium]|nr:type II restriction endonuclease [Candidatus Omnitrophota bacterium]